jgi:predicted GH43/DUF377 family glycosyl hydrolase
MIVHQFPIGAKVIFTNDYGVCFGVKTITGHDERSGKPTYHYTPTDTPWFSTEEDNLKLADAEDLSVWKHGVSKRRIEIGSEAMKTRDGWMQEKHGRPTTKEELAALLDGDPFDGEE